MILIRNLVVGIILATASVGASASIPYTLFANFDLTLDTKYEAGDKPIPGGASCSTWTCDSLGTASGEIDEASATQLDFAASGPDDYLNYDFAYKTFASGDIQVCATVPDQSTWVGYHENFTGFGVKIQEGLDPPTYFAHVWNPYVSDIPRFKIGTPAANTSAQGDSATAGPEKVCLTHKESTDEFKAWQSNDGSTYTQIGATVVHDSGTLYAGVFGDAHEAGQVTSVSLTGVTASATIDIYTDATGPAFTSGPAAGTPTVSSIPITFTMDKAGNLYGIACPNGQTFPTQAECRANTCGGGGAPSAIFFSQFAASLESSANLTGLAASTTYDLHFCPRSEAGVDAAAITSVQNITTDADEPPPDPDGTCAAPFASANNDTYGSGFDLTADEGCRNANDIVAGWDFSMPAETPIAANGGLWTGSESGDYPPYYKGNKIYKCDLEWDDLEPTQDNYDWDTADACFNKVGNGFDGVYLNVRGVVAKIRNCSDTANYNGAGTVTAPAWVQSIAALDVQACKNGLFQIHNVNLANTTIRNHYKDFIADFVAQGYQNVSPLFHQLSHFASQSGGEECCGGLSDEIIKELIDAWATNYGARISAFSYQNEDSILWPHAMNAGMGNSGGQAELWLKSDMHPGASAQTGLSQDANGHFVLNESFAPILEARTWGEQGERIGTSKFPFNEGRNYIASQMSILMHRRNNNWDVASYHINPRAADFVSTEMGHTAATSPDAWAWLMETRGKSGGDVNTIHNFERWMFQRDALGATTSTNKLLHGQNMTGNGTQPATSADCNFAGDTNCYAAAWSKRENNAANAIGFALDDVFWPTLLTHDVVFKVLYKDSGTAVCHIRNNAGTNLATFTLTNSGELRTATRFVDNFRGSGAGFALDFDIECNSPVDFTWVRIIKNGGSFATW